MVRIVLHKSRIKLLPPFILWMPLSLCLLKTRVLQSTAEPKWDKNGKRPAGFKLVLDKIFKSVFFKLFVSVTHPYPSCSLCAAIEQSTKCLCRVIVLSPQISRKAGNELLLCQEPSWHLLPWGSNALTSQRDWWVYAPILPTSLRLVSAVQLQPKLTKAESMKIRSSSKFH